MNNVIPLPEDPWGGAWLALLAHGVYSCLRELNLAISLLRIQIYETHHEKTNNVGFKLA